MGCFGINLVKLRQHQAKKLMRSCGLEPRQVKLQNGSTMDCWEPSKKKSGKPALLLIHGIVFNALLEWENQLQVFVKEFDVYVPNLLFFGDSTTESEQRSEVFQAECLKQMLDELSVSNAHVLGTSYGGLVAFWMAHFYPENVDKVVIASSGVAMDFNVVLGFLERYGDGVTRVDEVLMPTTLEAARKTINLATYKKPFLPNCLLEDIVEEVFNYNREHRAELLEGLIIGSKNAPELPTLSQDVLILWGEQDEIFRPELGHRLKAHLDKVARLVLIPESGHTPQTENPKPFNAEVLEFLRQP